MSDAAPGVSWDAIVVGAGPNGLAAAITLARAGRSVLVLEANQTVGGGSRSAALTLPGFVHDVCSAIHPLGRGSPVFAEWPLAEHGLEWIDPPVAIAHPLDDGSAAIVRRDLEATAAGFGEDADRYRALAGPVARDWGLIARSMLGPLNLVAPLRHPIALGRFGLNAIQPATWLARRFRTPQARALLAGIAAHSFLRLDQPITGAFVLAFLGSAHAVGWPIPRGGSQRIADALASYLRSLGGEIRTDERVTDLRALPRHRAVLLDLTPRQILAIAGDRFPGGYARQLRRYRYGPGVFKVDLALDEPVPWTNPALREAGTIHLGGTLEEIAAAERAVARGHHPARPFTLVAQPSVFDPSRAPAGKHTLWAYCHVPNGSREDMTERILDQIERFAPGTRRLIIGRSTMDTAAVEAYNANYVGGDINGGLQNVFQLWTRPAVRLDPYSTPDPGIFICSSSTPPGGGVHGLCGWHAARSALRGVLT
ncbi:MAG TPA: NAD(P)/FAD-dependent oxidoreductase [candidate division Zixibacteria bacterium]|nr:NAD(P)/FAD-dependent oxidoreductase [candidate division Zixibacteria bacterium]